MQSQRTLPAGVSSRMQRWPMPNLGVVVMEVMPGEWASGVKVLVWEPRIWRKEVQVWPVGGTNWRGSFLPCDEYCRDGMLVCGKLITTHIADSTSFGRFFGGNVELCAAGDADEKAFFGVHFHRTYN